MVNGNSKLDDILETIHFNFFPKQAWEKRVKEPTWNHKERNMIGHCLCKALKLQITFYYM